ncbi:MAG: rod shape-determining protein MreD [Bdellovibrionales bacterium]|nr:rod shape-determining protein MreD [Bdellovibrionales bacterium]
MISLRHSIIFLFLGFVAIFIQGTLLKFISPTMISPNFLVMLVVYLGFERISVAGVILAFLLGFELDLCSAQLLGPWAGAFVIGFSVIAAMSQHVFVESPFAVSLAVAAANIITALVYAGMVYEFQPAGVISFWPLLLESVLSALVAPIVYVMLKAILPHQDKKRGGKFSSSLV